MNRPFIMYSSWNMKKLRKLSRSAFMCYIRLPQLFQHETNSPLEFPDAKANKQSGSTALPRLQTKGGAENGLRPKKQSGSSIFSIYRIIYPLNTGLRSSNPLQKNLPVKTCYARSFRLRYRYAFHTFSPKGCGNIVIFAEMRYFTGSSCKNALIINNLQKQ